VGTESWPFETAIRGVVELLARGEYPAVERLSAGIRLTAQEMAAAINEYGRHLIVPPSAAAAPLDVIPHADGGGWSVYVPLWTLEEGHSDLTLQLTVRPEPDGGHRVEVDDLHVL